MKWKGQICDSSLRAVDQEGLWGCQNNAGYCHWCWCPPKSESKILFLKTPPTSVMGQAGNFLPTGESSWFWKVLCRLLGENSSTRVFRCAPCILHNQALRQTRVASLWWVWSVTSWMDFIPASREGIYAWYCTGKPTAKEGISDTGDTTAVVLWT